MGMMTKYQLVFVKMETAFAKIFNHNKLRDLRKMQRAFTKMKDNAVQKRLDIVCGAKIALENYKALGKIFNKYEKNQKLNMRDAFHTWKTLLTGEKIIKEKEERLNEKIEDKRAEAKHLERKIKEVEVEIRQVDKEYTKFEENKERIKKQDGIPSDLKAEINHILKSTPSSIYRGDHSVMSKLKVAFDHAVMTNKELSRDLNSTNDNVKGFIEDMSTLMSTHSLTSTIDQTLEEECGGSSFYNEDQRQEYTRPTKKYTPHYNTATQGGSSSHGRRKRRVHK
mmetsp:Transcript_836/g.820  ORF Transcript_836/g.820 Transcript_836/m.820 type:complete len:281 (-) Transcript_836:19-861(-)